MPTQQKDLVSVILLKIKAAFAVLADRKTPSNLAVEWRHLIWGLLLVLEEGRVPTPQAAGEAADELRKIKILYRDQLDFLRRDIDRTVKCLRAREAQAGNEMPLIQTLLSRLNLLFSRLERNLDDPIFKAQIQSVLVIFDDSRLGAEDSSAAIAGLKALQEKYRSAREGNSDHYVKQAIKFLSRRLGETATEPPPPAVDDAATLTAGRILAEDFRKS